MASKEKKEKKPQWSNPHAQIMGPVSLIEPESVNLFECQPKDHGPYGTISDLQLRYLGRIDALATDIEGVKRILAHELEPQRREHFYAAVDSLESEIEIVVGFYREQFHYEREVKGWNGPPIYTLRKDGIVVIRDLDMRTYRAHIMHAPPKRMNTHDLYRHIALESIDRSHA